MNITIVNCFDTYEHRVDLLCGVFTDEGHEVRVLTSDYRHFEKKKRIEEKKDYIFFSAEPYKKNLSYQRLRSHRKLSKDIFRCLEEQAESIDLLWVLIPPNSFVKDAADYKERHQSVKLIFDIIDLWPESMTVGSIKDFFPFSIWKNLRDKNIRCADIVVTECHLYQEKIKEVLRGMKTETLYLARPVIPYKPHINLPENQISLCYLGSINNIIDISVISDIIIKLHKKKMVELHIIGDGERRDDLIKTAKEAGASVVFHGKIYNREEKQAVFDSCHYGLNIMKDSVCVGLTMKSMDYLEFGLPMINNIPGDTWELIQRHQFGINWPTDDGFEGYSHRMRENAREYFEHFLSTASFSDAVHRIIDL